MGCGFSDAANASGRGGKLSASSQDDGSDGSDGLGPADEDEDEPKRPGENIDETSAGGLRYPHDSAQAQRIAPKP